MIVSEELGLELRVSQRQLRFYDPVSGKKLLTTEEREIERVRSDLARQLAEDDKRIAEAQKQQIENQIKNAIPQLKIFGLSDEQIAQTLGLDLNYVQQILMTE